MQKSAQELYWKLKRCALAVQAALVAGVMDVPAYQAISPKHLENEFLGNKYAGPFGAAVENACQLMNKPGEELQPALSCGVARSDFRSCSVRSRGRWYRQAASDDYVVSGCFPRCLVLRLTPINGIFGLNACNRLVCWVLLTGVNRQNLSDQSFGLGKHFSPGVQNLDGRGRQLPETLPFWSRCGHDRNLNFPHNFPPKRSTGRVCVPAQRAAPDHHYLSGGNDGCSKSTWLGKSFWRQSIRLRSTSATRLQRFLYLVDCRPEPCAGSSPSF